MALVCTEIHQLFQKQTSRERIKAGHRLIQHQQFRLVTQCRNDREFLALAHGEAAAALVQRQAPLTRKAFHQRLVPVRPPGRRGLDPDREPLERPGSRSDPLDPRLQHRRDRR